jgi:hypothetical protein
MAKKAAYAITSSTEKRDEGAKNKVTRSAARLKLVGLKGQDVRRLNANEKDDLLVVVCQLLNLADDKGIIK